jgi:hypothetical protein
MAKLNLPQVSTTTKVIASVVATAAALAAAAAIAVAKDNAWLNKNGFTPD